MSDTAAEEEESRRFWCLMIGLTVDVRTGVIRAPQTESRISHSLRSLKSVYDKEEGAGRRRQREKYEEEEAKNKPPPQPPPLRKRIKAGIPGRTLLLSFYFEF